MSLVTAETHSHIMPHCRFSAVSRSSTAGPCFHLWLGSAEKKTPVEKRVDGQKEETKKGTVMAGGQKDKRDTQRERERGEAAQTFHRNRHRDTDEEKKPRKCHAQTPVAFTRPVAAKGLAPLPSPDTEASHSGVGSVGHCRLQWDPSTAGACVWFV